MKKFAFVSDFDGTLSSRDFYQIVIDKFMGEKGRAFYNEWKKTKKINVEFLNIIFSSMNLTEKQIFEEILKIPIDPYAGDFISNIRKNDGDFYIVSAGTSYYIKILFEYLGIKDVNIISMEGIYSSGGIKITPDPKSPYYSDIFGLDKQKVVDSLREDHEYILFAGDSEPDLRAAKAADMIYARGELEELLLKEGKKFMSFCNFKEIEKDLIEKGFIG